MKPFLEELFSRRGGMKLGLGRIKEAFAELQSVDASFFVYHVAGTNGKGSVVYALSHLLEKGGHRVGTFVSPHIQEYNERILFNGDQISDSDLERLFGELNRQVSIADDLSFFEVTFLLAWLYFVEKGATRVVFEVGLGGRLDATNVLPSRKCDIITSVGLDHTRILGDTLQKIAAEKGGIVKRGDTLFLSELLEDDIKQLLEKDAFKAGAAMVCFPFVDPEAYPHSPLSSVQKENMKLASSAIVQCEGSNATTDLSALKIPGRYEIINDFIILDVAHNPPAMVELASFVKSYEQKKPVMIYGAMRDKDIKSALMPFSDTVESLYLLELDNDGRGATPHDIEMVMPTEIEKLYIKTENNKMAFEKALSEAETKGVRLLVTGSFFTLTSFFDFRKERGD
ncbi:hypothetical protein KAH37_08185 [bacterium]|nr:hypothetical protein [bacterium]